MIISLTGCACSDNRRPEVDNKNAAEMPANRQGE